MISPCPKCGATKTDPVPHDFKYKLARIFGYRLQQCSRCRAARSIRIPRGESLGASLLADETGSSGWLVEEGESPGTAEAPPESGREQLTGADSWDFNLPHCPDCGSTSYHRTRRTAPERMLRRPPMARCESCGMRFPYPGHHEEYPGKLKLAVAAAREPHSAAEESAPRMAIEKTRSEVPKHAAGTDSSEADISDRESSCCPFCGSAVFHRSRRRTLERLLLRPRMARCSDCRKRFPFPER